MEKKYIEKTLEFYENKDFDSAQITEIKLGLKQGLDVSIYANSRLDEYQMHEMLQGLEYNKEHSDKPIDISIYANGNFNWRQMKQIRLGLEGDFTEEQVRFYADTKFNSNQMYEICLTFENRLIDIDEDLTIMGMVEKYGIPLELL